MESSQPLPITGRHTPQHSTAGPPALDGKRRPSQPLIERPGLADLFDQTRAHSITQTSYMTKMTHTTRTHTQRNTAQHSGLRHPSDTLTQKPAPTATLLVYPGDKSMQAGLWAAWLGVLRSSVVPWVPWDGRHERLIDGGVDPHHLIGGRQTLACVLEPYQLGLARHGGRVVGVQAVAQHQRYYWADISALTHTSVCMSSHVPWLPTSPRMITSLTQKHTQTDLSTSGPPETPGRDASPQTTPREKRGKGSSGAVC
mmetsp:Transcript_49211/g.123320  ORF Transcript_49211/g.123320 Transcript_49211/m.123320 type:complete len:256 (+) Transcript_49211:984-1751(+)